jgi:hypothetical protein
MQGKANVCGRLTSTSGLGVRTAGAGSARMDMRGGVGSCATIVRRCGACCKRVRAGIWWMLDRDTMGAGRGLVSGGFIRCSLPCHFVFIGT